MIYLCIHLHLLFELFTYYLFIYLFYLFNNDTDFFKCQSFNVTPSLLLNFKYYNEY